MHKIQEKSGEFCITETFSAFGYSMTWSLCFSYTYSKIGPTDNDDIIKVTQDGIHSFSGSIPNGENAIIYRVSWDITPERLDDSEDIVIDLDNIDNGNQITIGTSRNGPMRRKLGK